MINNNLILIILNTLINLIDVLLILLPVLLAVAFMTIIERKQLAAHQRRVGPNTVGKKQNNLKNLIQSQRFLHILHDKNRSIISTLYQNRVAPVKLFKSKIVDTCYNITSSEQRALFFKKYQDKGGIYLIQYTDDLSIYYTGRSIN